MIKNYLELNPIEVERAYEFVSKNKKDIKSFEELDKEFRDEIYNFGEGILFKLCEGDVISKASIILKSAIETKKAYIIDLDISEKSVNKSLIVSEILNKAKTVAKSYGAKEVYIGTKDEKIINILSDLNIQKEYSAIKMTLEDKDIKYNPFELVPLSENNKVEYREIFNNAFKDTPNAGLLSDNQVDEYIKIANENNYFFIVTLNNKNIGFLQCKIEDNIGEFDIGLIQSARGKGYGKRLLETAIDVFNSKNVEKVSLVVITKNSLAYDMYKKRGFKKSQLLSHWFMLRN